MEWLMNKNKLWVATSGFGLEVVIWGSIYVYGTKRVVEATKELVLGQMNMRVSTNGFVLHSFSHKKVG